ncbi:MAG: hypothetical protein FWH34_08000 [Desulfovibrionaceae bacterium]|nr:hypothetical protein [Desulfovibrionaceae bacterium]
MVQEGLSLPEQEVAGEIKGMEFDEMWHFVQEKKITAGREWCSEERSRPIHMLFRRTE